MRRVQITDSQHGVLCDWIWKTLQPSISGHFFVIFRFFLSGFEPVSLFMGTSRTDETRRVAWDSV